VRTVVCAARFLHHASDITARGQNMALFFFGGWRMTETNKSHFMFLARKMRERAEEARTLAEEFRDPQARRMMFEIAERYEKLAQRLEDEA